MHPDVGQQDEVRKAKGWNDVDPNGERQVSQDSGTPTLSDCGQGHNPDQYEDSPATKELSYDTDPTYDCLPLSGTSSGTNL